MRSGSHGLPCNTFSPGHSLCHSMRLQRNTVQLAKCVEAARAHAREFDPPSPFLAQIHGQGSQDPECVPLAARTLGWRPPEPLLGPNLFHTDRQGMCTPVHILVWAFILFFCQMLIQFIINHSAVIKMLRSMFYFVNSSPESLLVIKLRNRSKRSEIIDH